MNSVLDTAFNVVHDYPGGAGTMALRLGKSATTLAHEVRAAGTAKLGLVDAVKITQFSNDLRILNDFAAQCSCVVIPMPDVGESDAGVMPKVAALARDFSTLISSTIEAEADNRITGNELSAIEAEWAVLVAHGQALIGSLRSQHEAGQPVVLRRAE